MTYILTELTWFVAAAGGLVGPENDVDSDEQNVRCCADHQTPEVHDSPLVDDVITE